MTPAHPLDGEWLRVELLARSLHAARSGEPVPHELLDELVKAQSSVTEARGGGGWAGVADDDLERDILAAVLAADARPSVGWLLEALQPGSEPYPCPALLHELLVLDAARARDMYERLGELAPLRAHGLIELAHPEPGPYVTLRPTARARAALLGWDQPASPPGAARVATRATWDDLVLPDAQLTVLEEFIAHIRHRRMVADELGGRIGGGPVALFCGAPGTGKTFAAGVIAAELDWPLYRVDLGRLVSKYIGETEKNLDRLLDAAHGRPVVLQFDEADSLFGRRGEIRDARDRYANLEVSYLLARIERHDGPCVLTTNMRRHLDVAFTRRFGVVVEFPRPDVTARARLWQRLLPPRAPLASDLDLRVLAEPTLTGGGIHNAATHAAVLAAQAGSAIGLREAAIAVWREMAKDGREMSRSALGSLAEHLPAAFGADREPSERAFSETHPRGG
jgi:hypothetical protein